MRKYENADIVAALGAVVEINTEHYKGDFRYDLETFRKAAQHPDGENNRFLWLSRQSGTECVKEREAFINGSEAHHRWNYYGTVLGGIDSYMSSVVVNDHIMAYAVVVTGLENGRVMGDLYQLDYRDSIRDIQKAALPLHTVSGKFEDGTDLRLPHAEYDGQRERLRSQHGPLSDYRVHPEDEGALQTALNAMRDKREKDAWPATFKARVRNPRKPSVIGQLEAGQKQIAAHRAAPNQAEPRRGKKAEAVI
ncbi:MAG: hypothetical protein LBI19_08070 [Oscillospiraceae bacterium]|jgi:hypothetical protein|nr:hypothetical protein [Oscillospiraceae bacterium]